MNILPHLVPFFLMYFHVNCRYHTISSRTYTSPNEVCFLSQPNAMIKTNKMCNNSFMSWNTWSAFPKVLLQLVWRSHYQNKIHKFVSVCIRARVLRGKPICPAKSSESACVVSVMDPKFTDKGLGHRDGLSGGAQSPGSRSRVKTPLSTEGAGCAILCPDQMSRPTEGGKCSHRGCPLLKPPPPT